MPITALPTPPSRDDPANFATRADAFLGALPVFATETNDVISEMYNILGVTNIAASQTSSYRDAALASAQLAAASAGAAKWVSGQVYAEGVVVYSTVTALVYRKITPSSSSAVDPANDATNWMQISTGIPIVTVVNTTGYTTTAFRHVVMTNASAFCTVNLPANPRPNDLVYVTFTNSSLTNIIGRNNQNIMSVAENMTVDSVGATVKLMFIDSAIGWRVL
jgi:hypothetical protein